jgi:hypothetical protein
MVAAHQKVRVWVADLGHHGVHQRHEGVNAPVHQVAYVNIHRRLVRAHLLRLLHHAAGLSAGLPAGMQVADDPLHAWQQKVGSKQIVSSQVMTT